ncbi:MAG: hypothetical protein IKA61_00495 [Clostridia bacterium]|nr:hypothetical protein [Clostridia bacterium]
MTTRSMSVQNFNDKMADLINSKFILAEKKISEVLICISDSVLLFELFKHALEGFDYSTVKSVCFTHDINGNGYFQLPKGDGDVLALTFTVLSEIDCGNIDLIDLCAEYFPSAEGKQRSYSIFATKLLIPFQQKVTRLARMIIESEDLGEISKDNLQSREKEYPTMQEPEEKPQPKNTPTAKRQATFGYVTALKNQVAKVADSLKKGREPYDELFFALEEMELYLQTKNLRGITLAFTAIKYVRASAKKIEVDLDKISKIVSEAVI